jgi:hypothetical protein
MNGRVWSDMLYNIIYKKEFYKRIIIKNKINKSIVAKGVVYLKTLLIFLKYKSI